MKKSGTNNSIGLGYFNLARGIGMVLILLGHSMTPFFSVKMGDGLFSGAGSVLGGGIMAMFFLISGYGFFSRSFRKCWDTQWKLLLKPYWITAAAILASKVLLAILKQRSFADHGGDLVTTYLLGLNAEGGAIFLGMAVDSVSILWFILALFGGWVLYNGICRIKSNPLRTLLTVTCVVSGWLLTLVSDVWPFCLPMALMAVGYLAVGDVIRRRGWLTDKLPIWSWLLILVVVLVCGAVGRVNMVACRWKLGLLDVAGSFCMGFLLLRLYHFWMQKNFRGKLLECLENVGLHSLWIVFLHGYEKVIFPWYRLGELLPGNPALCTVLCFALRCAVIYALLRLLQWVRRKLQKKRVKPAMTLQ